MHKSPHGFIALLLLITFLSGILLFFLGVIGEYAGRIYEESKSRPFVYRQPDRPQQASSAQHIGARWETRETEATLSWRSERRR